MRIIPSKITNAKGNTMDVYLYRDELCFYPDTTEIIHVDFNNKQIKLIEYLEREKQ